MKTTGWVRKELKRSLSLLAAPAEEQLAHLREIGCADAIDELALELDDVLPGGHVSSELALTEEQLRKVRAVQQQLAEISGPQHAEIWQAEALANRAEWSRIREVASQAAAAL